MPAAGLVPRGVWHAVEDALDVRRVRIERLFGDLQLRLPREIDRRVWLAVDELHPVDGAGEEQVHVATQTIILRPDGDGRVSPLSLTWPEI